MAKNKNILIAESGSTKADWVSICNGVQHKWKTEGLNALVLKDRFEDKLKTALALGQILNSTQEWNVYFYGAGCTLKDLKKKVKNTFKDILPGSSIAVHNDLLAAANASCGDDPGIVGILGTGSSIGHFDGEQFVDYVMSGGFLIGDEGSGFQIGQEIIKRYVRGEFSGKEMKSLKSVIKHNYPNLVSIMYSHERPNYYMASFGVLIEKLSEKSKNEILNKVFERFIFDRVLKQKKIHELPIHLVGSVAWYHRELLYHLFGKVELKISSVIKSPIDNLIKYHLDKLEKDI